MLSLIRGGYEAGRYGGVLLDFVTKIRSKGCLENGIIRTISKDIFYEGLNVEHRENIVLTVDLDSDKEIDMVVKNTNVVTDQEIEEAFIASVSDVIVENVVTFPDNVDNLDFLMLHPVVDNTLEASIKHGVERTLVGIVCSGVVTVGGNDG